MRVKITLCLCLISLSAVATELKTPLKVAAIDWCPQLCPKLGDKQGFIQEIVELIYAGSKYDLKVEFYPWSRALTMVRQGRVDAILSPAKAEAPDLLYPLNEVGLQRMCFFTTADDSWNYESVSSLSGRQFGIATDTSIEELNEYAEKHQEQFQYQPYHDRYIMQQANKVKRKRVDAFLFTYNSTVYELKRRGVQEQFRNAGCVTSTYVYMAFTPNPSMQNKIAPAIDYFDQQMLKLKQGEGIEDIMQRYGLEDWRQLE